MKKLILISLLAMAGVWTMQAQTADSTAAVEVQADTTVVLGNGGIRRSIEFPEKLREFLGADKYKEALAEYLKFRPTIEGDDFGVTFSDMEIYRTMAENMPEKTEYKEKYEAAKKKIHSTYSKRIEVILMELDELSSVTDQDRIRVYTKVIEADSTYTQAYLDKGYALMNLGRMKEACYDFSKHPDYDKMPWKAECERLFEQEVMEKAAQEEATKAEEK